MFYNAEVLKDLNPDPHVCVKRFRLHLCIITLRCVWRAVEMCVSTSLTAHMRAMDPMLLVMVTSVALARSSLLMLSRFSLLIM